MLAEEGFPIVWEEIKNLLARITKRNPPEVDPNSTPESKIKALEDYVGEVEGDLKEAVEALQKTSAELVNLASVANVLRVRVTIALLLSGSAVVIGIGCWLFVLFRH